MKLQRLLMISTVALAGLGAGQAAFADQRPDGPPPECRQHDKKCPKPKDARHAPPPAEGGRREAHPNQLEAVRIGDDARDGRVFKPQKHGNLRAAPRGQEYRVIRDQLALVRKKDGRVLSVLGPMQERR
ncbi:hypothetical protein [Paracoccus laeviglucosivorans]|uniref:Nickel/cobalt transporter regulator n=1 Tax=Paracoccus laeviglucosivorans TaxID=1197861 RepID=A0A521FAA9_9RHOB|nr:hypothetical protein [Paracoccus laeviglucosivorans]SMO93105.1 hypothetical protein SAMN06265221_11946 [Paracoccus laeviglucosivorans]